MKKLTIPAYAKINLSLDVLRKQADGYHQVKMVMHQIQLHDAVTVSWKEGDEFQIALSCGGAPLPGDERNIACKAVQLMQETYGRELHGTVTVQLEKHIPVAAGLAGGSADGAAVILALNLLWDLGLSMKKLMALGKQLGADVPFCVMGQIAAGKGMWKPEGWEAASTCALAEGIGEILTPLPTLDSLILLSKPPIGVSTATVYGGLCLEEIRQRPDTDQLITGLREHNLRKITGNMVNLLETVTLKKFPLVQEEKDALKSLNTAAAVLMSGSGPSVFALYTNRRKAEAAYAYMKGRNKETYLTKTLRP